MNTRFEICTPRKGNDGKTRWLRIGTAWQSDKGTQLVFDALPIPDAEGRCVANLFEPRDNSAAKSPPAKDYPSHGKQADPFGDDLDDNVPF